MEKTDKELMTIDQFLAIYGISRTKYFSERDKGKLKVTKDGKRTYIKRTDAEEWLSKFGDAS